MLATAKIMLAALAMIATANSAEQAFAQFANTTVQLPTFRVTQFNSSFSVPDGGTVNIGSIGSSRSVPGGRSGGCGSAQVTAHILIMKELEQEMLTNARPAIRQSNLAQQQINGSATTQSQADFISGNINRR